ncbi:MAG: Asp-tRNA(Asn)/Glu-tRNA(Gln) amidotransferase subunit GatB [Fervidicoccaceae archaeon]
MSSEKIIIGLEIHVQLTSLKTKLFCNCSSNYRDMPPNTNVCPICLGLPGSLPVVNKEAVKKALLVALALNMKISNRVSWARKHYFYPDLPKNYQITQYEGKGVASIAREGYLEYYVDGNLKKARIRRINLEEDPGKIIYHTGSMLTSKYSLIDYNRSGVALLEIVTEPDFNSPKEVIAFLQELRSVLEYLEVADFNLEGSMRVDVNISIEGGSRVEVKNIGSISEIEAAILYEVARQRSLREKGIKIEMETRHWDQERKATVGTRTKETEEDYRYFPDPNLPPVEIEMDYLEGIAKEMPELPNAKRERLIKEYGLSSYLSYVITSNKKLAEYFEEVMKYTKIDGEKAAALIVNDLVGWIGQERIKDIGKLVPPAEMANLLELLRKGDISIKIAKETIPELVSGRKTTEVLLSRGWLGRISGKELDEIVERVMRENEKAVEDALRNPKAIQFLIGKVMEVTNKKADPKETYELIVKKIGELQKRTWSN